MNQIAHFDRAKLLRELKNSPFNQETDKVMRALDGLAKKLEGGYKLDVNPDEIIQKFAQNPADEIEIRKLFAVRPFRIFFTTSLSQNGELIITAFLGARPEELAQRRKTLRNANKHLFHGFLASNAKLKRRKGFAEDMLKLARETEHTAYAKFYVTPYNRGKGKREIAIIMHPFQRARLVYDPSSEIQYTKFNHRVKRVKGMLTHLLHSNNPTLNKARPTIQQLLLAIQQVGDSATHEGEGFKNSLSVLDALIRGVRKSPDLKVVTATREKMSRQDPAKSQGKPTLRGTEHLRTILLRFRGDAIHVRNMYKRKGNEHPYASAGNISGRRRELVLYLVSGLARRAFEEVFRIPAYRYMLSPNQIGSIRLMKERGQIREKIKAFPEQLMKRQKRITEPLTIPLNPVTPSGESLDPVPFTLDMVSLDRRKIIIAQRQLEKRKKKREMRKNSRKRNR